MTMPQTACPCCNRTFKTGQAPLTDHEIRRLPMGNQNTKWNVIRWQVVKGAAMFFDVNDWTSKVDASLSYEENVAIMAKHGLNKEIGGGGQTMRELAPEAK